MKVDWKKVLTVLKWSAVTLLAMAWASYEYVNWVTTHDSLEYAFAPGPWVTVISIGVVLADLGAVILVFVPADYDRNDKIRLGMTATWLIVTTMDIFLNYYFVSVKMEANTTVIAPNLVKNSMVVVPFAIAIMIWAVQMGMIYTLSAAIERVIIPPKKQDKPYVPQAPINKPQNVPQYSVANPPPGRVTSLTTSDNGNGKKFNPTFRHED